jgi:hypothetical protein
MEKKKQTAVEWLLEKYKSQNTLLFADDFEQAKAMESNEQVISVPIYYYEDEDDDNKKVYDFEEMTKEFELALTKL